MRVLRISRQKLEEEQDYKDEFESSLEDDGMSSEEEAFIRGWESY